MTLIPTHIIFAAASIIIPNKNFRNFEKNEILLVEEFVFGIRKSLHLRFVDLNLEFKVTLTPCQTCRIYHRGTLGRSLWQRSHVFKPTTSKGSKLVLWTRPIPDPGFWPWHNSTGGTKDQKTSRQTWNSLIKVDKSAFMTHKLWVKIIKDEWEWAVVNYD